MPLMWWEELLDKTRKRMGNLPDRWQRRLMRNAIQTRDINKIRHLLSKGMNVNMIISEVFWDTPLTFSVKHGYLEVVEFIASHPECQLDQQDRNKHSALDEAIRAYLIGASPSTELKQHLSRRYRILKCLLQLGAKDVTYTFLDMLVFSVLNTESGHDLIEKLVKCFCDYGCQGIISAIYCVLVSYVDTEPYVHSLLSAGASPELYLNKDPCRLVMPFDNAILLVRFSNNFKLLSRIESDIFCNLREIEENWSLFKHIVILKAISGHSFQLHLTNYLYNNHADIYKWLAAYTSEPKPLSHLCRISIRQQLKPNIFVGLHNLKVLPDAMNSFILLREL